MSRLDYFSPSGLQVSFLTGPGASARLTEVAGMEGLAIKPMTLKSPGQSGETALDLLVPSRTITVSGILQATTNDALWILRRQIINVLAEQPVRSGATLQLGYLQLTRNGQPTLQLQCVPVNIAMPRPAGTMGMCAFDIEFYAPYPFWTDTYDTYLNFSAAGGNGANVQFPLTMATNNISQDVINSGDVDAPMLVTINGGCTNPNFTNNTTGEVIALVGALAAGDYIVIDTTFGSKSVTLYHLGVGTSAMSWVNLATTTFWQLRPGLQNVGFTASLNPSGSVVATYRRRYSGI